MNMVKVLNEQNFESEILNSKGVALVDFYADWCGPCKMVAPIVAQIADERTDVVVGKINVDDSMEIARKYNIVSIPTLIVFKDGKASAQMVGFRSKQEILEMLN